MKEIGNFKINKVDGSVTYTELNIFKGEVTPTEVLIMAIERGYHNGGSTVRETTRFYPISFLSAFTGEYDSDNDRPVIDLTILGDILQPFGITLVSP